MRIVRAAAAVTLAFALPACEGPPGPVCEAEGRQLTQQEMIARAVKELPGTGYKLDPQVVGRLSEAESRDLAEQVFSYVHRLKNQGTFLQKFPDCCSLVTPAEFDRDGPVGPQSGPDKYKVFAVLRANYAVPFDAKSTGAIEVPVRDAVAINNCGTTVGTSG